MKLKSVFMFLIISLCQEELAHSMEQQGGISAEDMKAIVEQVIAQVMPRLQYDPSPTYRPVVQAFHTQTRTSPPPPTFIPSHNRPEPLVREDSTTEAAVMIVAQVASQQEVVELLAQITTAKEIAEPIAKVTTSKRKRGSKPSTKHSKKARTNINVKVAAYEKIEYVDKDESIFDWAIHFEIHGEKQKAKQHYLKAIFNSDDGFADARALYKMAQHYELGIFDDEIDINKAKQFYEIICKRWMF